MFLVYLVASKTKDSLEIAPLATSNASLDKCLEYFYSNWVMGSEIIPLEFHF